MSPARSIHTLLALLLLACGGGSGGGSSGKGISIAIDSPIEGTRIVGSRSIVITGTVVEGASVTVSTNGGAEVEASVSGRTFSADLTLRPRENAIVARATKADASATASVSVFYPFLSLRTFQDASVVIGQPDFRTASDAMLPRGFRGSVGWDGTQLYLSDNWKLRVYAGVPTRNGAVPSFTLAAVNVGAASAVRLESPAPLADNGKLLIADAKLNRVFIVDALPSADEAVASVVIGQGTDCTRSGLSNPSGAFVAGGKLLVVDEGHHRTLIWNSVPTSSDKPPDLVLGQPDFNTCNARTSASGLYYPSSVWGDGARLLMNDIYNNRILGWSTFPTENGQAADLVLGQRDFASGAPDVNQGSFYYPTRLTSNGNQLFVVDQLNHRLLVWNTMPSATGALPDVVLGQSDFVHGTKNDADQNGIEDDTPSANTLSHPSGILALDDVLIVGDSENARYLVFRSE